MSKEMSNEINQIIASLKNNKAQYHKQITKMVDFVLKDDPVPNKINKIIVSLKNNQRRFHQQIAKMEDFLYKSGPYYTSRIRFPSLGQLFNSKERNPDQINFTFPSGPRSPGRQNKVMPRSGRQNKVMPR